MLPAIELYTDGSCINNPGPGGTGVVIRYREVDPVSGNEVVKQVEDTRGFRLTTNNRMEITAALDGVEKILTMIDQQTIKDSYNIILSTDSQYFCNAINNKWIDKWASNNWQTSPFQGKPGKPVANRDLWERWLNVVKPNLDAHSISLTITHIKGHAGHEFNEKCDQIANSTARGTNTMPDQAYEDSKR